MTTVDDDLQYPYPLHIQRRLDECLSFGITSIIEILPSGNVRKSPHPQAGAHDRRWMRQHLEREFEIYQRLPKRHNRLIQMISYSEEGLILEYMPTGNLREYLESYAVTITVYQRLQWIANTAEALQLVHSYNVIHCDVKPENFLLDSELQLRIIDFSGSCIDGKRPLVLENTRFFLPRSREEPCTVLTDLFALGSSIYEIMTGSQPYKELTDDEVESRYNKRHFPVVDNMPCGAVIMKCWLSEYDSAEQAHVAIKAEIQKYMTLHPDLCYTSSLPLRRDL